MTKVRVRLLVFAATLLLLGLSEGLHSRPSTGTSPGYKDPGVRSGDAGAGGFLPGLSELEKKFFQAGLEDFEEAEGVGRWSRPALQPGQLRRLPHPAGHRRHITLGESAGRRGYRVRRQEQGAVVPDAERADS